MELPQRIESERLIFRPPVMEDAQAFFDSYTSDPIVPKFMVWRPHTDLSEVQGFLASCIQAWQGSSRFPYALTLRDDESTPIGMLDAVLERHMIDIGYVLGRKFWGQGLMPEAVMAFYEMALQLPGVFRIQATCDVENIQSVRTLEKSGFIREGTLARHTVHPNISAEPRTCYMYARCK